MSKIALKMQELKRKFLECGGHRLDDILNKHSAILTPLINETIAEFTKMVARVFPMGENFQTGMSEFDNDQWRLSVIFTLYGSEVYVLMRSTLLGSVMCHQSITFVINFPIQNYGTDMLAASLYQRFSMFEDDSYPNLSEDTVLAAYKDNLKKLPGVIEKLTTQYRDIMAGKHGQVLGHGIGIKDETQRKLQQEKIKKRLADPLYQNVLALKKFYKAATA